MSVLFGSVLVILAFCAFCFVVYVVEHIVFLVRLGDGSFGPEFVEDCNQISGVFKVAGSHCIWKSIEILGICEVMLVCGP